MIIRQELKTMAMMTMVEMRTQLRLRSVTILKREGGHEGQESKSNEELKELKLLFGGIMKRLQMATERICDMEGESIEGMEFGLQCQETDDRDLRDEKNETTRTNYTAGKRRNFRRNRIYGGEVRYWLDEITRFQDDSQC